MTMKSIKQLFSIFLLLVCAMVFAQTAQAQDTPFGMDNIPNIVGVGVAMVPDYQGSDDYMVGAAPFLKYTPEKTEYYALLLATQLSVNVINHPTFRFGPMVNYRFGRDDDVEDDVVKNMEEIDGTFEAGAFIGYEWIDKNNPLHRWGITLEFLGDVGNEHKGYILSATAKYWYPVHKMIDIGMGVGATYADNHYMNTYFGVSPEDSATTGLREFKAGSGIKDVRVIPAVVMHFSPQWHAGIGCRYQRLLDDAEDSPVVAAKDGKGGKDQWFYGIAVAYAW
jgi:outer membrane protein